MTSPTRLVLSRRRGYRMQEVSRALNGLECVNVARPSKWGNPFVVGEPSGCNFHDGGDPTPMIPVLTLDKCLELYRLLLSGIISPEMHPWGHEWMDAYKKQTGRWAHPAEGVRLLAELNLACWCDLPKDGEPDLCHAAILLELANPNNRPPAVSRAGAREE